MEHCQHDEKTKNARARVVRVVRVASCEAKVKGIKIKIKVMKRD